MITLENEVGNGKYVSTVRVSLIGGKSVGTSSYQTDMIVESSELRGYSPQYLADSESIELEKEIPLAIYQYHSGGKTTHSVKGFFEPELYKDVEWVQAVTVKFI